MLHKIHIAISIEVLKVCEGEKMFTVKKIAYAMLLLGAASVNASAAEVIQNGGFESFGSDVYDITGWSVAENNLLGGVLVEAGTVSSVTGNTTVGASSGNYYGLLDNYGSADLALYQAFTLGAVTSAVLSFDMFVNNQSGFTVVNNSGLDYTSGGSDLDNQHARVDLLAASADPFSTAPGDVLQTFYIGGGSNSVNGYSAYSFDLTTQLAAGGSYVLRFANVANIDTMQLGVDNVSLNAVAAVPEAETYLMMLAGLGLIGAVRLRQTQV